MDSGPHDPRDEAPSAQPPPPGQDEIASLSLRVAALESQLAELNRNLAARSSASGPSSDALSAAAPVTLRPRSSASSQTESHWRQPPPPAPIMPSAPPVPASDRPFAAPQPTEPAPRSLEDRLGAQVFNFIGMAALIIGASWALKLAFEHGLIGPMGRIVIGLAAGAGLILWSERFRRKDFRAFSYSLKAVGSGVLYLSLWAAFQLYHLLPASVAFAAMLLVTAWIAFMAWSQDAELLASYALLGGLATPLLLSTGGDHEAFLFLYLASLNAATTLLIRFKPWRRLLLPAYLATAAYFIGWYSSFFHRSQDAGLWDSQSTETALFIVLFFLIFAVASLRGWAAYPEGAPPRGEIILPVLIPLGNAAFLSLALYSVFQDSGLHGLLSWLMVLLAAVYLGLMRLQATVVASAMHLATAVIFLTIAIPLKASGHSLTIAWLVEGLVLCWACTRVRGEAAKPDRHDLGSRAPVTVLVLLSAAGYVLGLGSLLIRWFGPFSSVAPTFFNANLGSALVAIACLTGAAWLSARPPADALNPTPPRLLLPAVISIDLVALLLAFRELTGSSSFGRLHPAFANADFATALVGLAVLGAACWAAFRMVSAPADLHQPTLAFAATTLVLFNLVAIFSIVREIDAFWPRFGPEAADASLQRSLAVSAFLMVYGAVLLAAGFWRRDAFVRWQALILLIVTILKVFLSDVSGLSQGYRVASFLGLGALLMTVSFAYQRDWLGLKTSSPTPETYTGPNA